MERIYSQYLTSPSARKRVFDFVYASVALILASPVLLTAAVVVGLSCPASTAASTDPSLED
ncbi:MAG: hypothetical protein JOY85_14220 [Acidobacteriaceae bacterium]|nr:hypothetical protein [Acidobacteriaceae bacterium]